MIKRDHDSILKSSYYTHYTLSILLDQFLDIIGYFFKILCNYHKDFISDKKNINFSDIDNNYLSFFDNDEEFLIFLF